MKSFLGNFYRYLAIFIWSHCTWFAFYLLGSTKCKLTLWLSLIKLQTSIPWSHACVASKTTSVASFEPMITFKWGNHYQVMAHSICYSWKFNLQPKCAKLTRLSNQICILRNKLQYVTAVELLGIVVSNSWFVMVRQTDRRTAIRKWSFSEENLSLKLVERLVRCHEYSSSQNVEQLLINRCAAIARWIRLCLTSCCPGFKSQAHHLHFYHL